MREFFKGWQRKVGLATLSLALIFTVVWMQSEIRPIDIRFSRWPNTQFWFDVDEDWIQGELPLTSNGIPFAIKHWPVSMYLSLSLSPLSAYLLLSKPKSKTAPKQTTEPSPTTGA